MLTALILAAATAVSPAMIVDGKWYPFGDGIRVAVHKDTTSETTVLIMENTEPELTLTAIVEVQCSRGRVRVREMISEYRELNATFTANEPQPWDYDTTHPMYVLGC